MRGTGPLLFTTPVLPISRRSAKPTPFPAGPGERAHCRTRSLPCGHVAGRAGHPTAGAPCTAGGAVGGRVLDDPGPGADPAPARAHRRPDDGHRRARRRGPARAEPAVRAARHQPARAQRHRRHRDHLRRHGHAGAGVAVDRPHAPGPRSRGPGPGRHPARAHRAAVGAAARAGAADVLQGRLQLPRAERDHCARARPVLARPGRGTRRRRPAHPHYPHDLARHARPVRPTVPDAGARHHRADRFGRGAGGVRPPRPRPLRRGADHLGAAAAGPALRPRRRPRPLARRGEPAGVVPPGQRHPQRGPDDRADARRRRARAARPRPRPAFPPRPAVRARRGGGVAGCRGQAPGAAGARFRRDGRGPAAGRPGARRRRGGGGAVRGRGRGLRRARASGAGWASAGRARWVPRT